MFSFLSMGIIECSLKRALVHWMMKYVFNYPKKKGYWAKKTPKTMLPSFGCV